jgi:adhesin transport system outer membrane protein
MFIRRFSHVCCTVCVVAMFGMSTSANAQTWSLEHVAQQALSSHPEVLSKRSAAVAAQADVSAAEWQRFPTPGLSTNTDNIGEKFWQISLQQPIWAGGRITAGIASAKSKHDASIKAIDETGQDILIKVVNAYIDAERWKTRREVNVENTRQHELLLEMISRRVAVEASPAVDKELAQSRLFQAENDLSVAAQSLSNSFIQLSQLAGEQVSSTKPVVIDESLLPPNKEEAIKRAMDYSPVLARLAFEADAAAADIDLKRSAYSPLLAVRYERQNGFIQQGLSVTNDRVMLTLDSQFGAGLASVAGVDGAIAKLDAARQAHESAIRDLRQQVALEWDDMVASRDRLGNASKASSSSREVFESYTRQYTTGRKSWLDVLNSVREASQAELTVADATAQMSTASLRLIVLTGKFNFNLVP